MENDFFELPLNDTDRWLVGDARCKCCGYEWVAVVPKEHEWLECSNCGKYCGELKD